MLLPAIKKLCTRIRFDIVTMTATAQSGHPTSSLSAVELMALLYFKYLRYDVSDPDAETNDRVIFSKGHASPLLYALFHVAGIVSDKELITYRKIDSVLEGHPTPRFSHVSLSTGSLGQGLAVGLGEARALMSRYRDGASTIPRVFVLLGDGELSEGSVWEAVMYAGFEKPHNLIALVDVNGLEQSGFTPRKWDMEWYRKQFESCGWATIVVDGHDLTALDIAYQKALDYKGGPTVILANTIKGKGISFLEHKQGKHGKVLDEEEVTRALGELGAIDTSFVGIIKQPDRDDVHRLVNKSIRFNKHSSTYKTTATTREGFSKALVRLGVNDNTLIVFDGDLETSTYTHLFHEALPHQFVQCHIAEQLMVGMATGYALCGFYPVISSYGSFLTRAVDQLRMAALSGIPLMVNGSHGGVATGADGPSQMGLEDIGIMRGLHGSIVLSPADAVSAEKLTYAAYKQDAIVYLRTTRPLLSVIYDDKTKFLIGGSHVFFEKEKTPHTLVTIIATGTTLHEALKAQRELEQHRHIPTRVIDCYSIKPIDVSTIKDAVSLSNTVIVVEDHYPEGGLGEAVFQVCCDLSCPKIVHLAVKNLPRSGSMEELLRYEEIDAQAIVSCVTTS